MGERLTPHKFDLLQKYFEGRIIKLLKEHELDPDLGGGVGCVCDGFFKITTHWDYQDHIFALIKGQKDNETVSLLTEGEQK